MSNLKDLYQWFDENRNEIIKEHRSEFVLLKDNDAVAYFPSMEAALLDVEKRRFAVGTFLIQRCITKDEDTLIYHNMAVTFG